MNNTGYVITVSIDEIEDPSIALEFEQTSEDKGTVHVTLFNGNEKTFGTFNVETLRSAIAKFDSRFIL